MTDPVRGMVLCRPFPTLSTQRLCQRMARDGDKVRRALASLRWQLFRFGALMSCCSPPSTYATRWSFLGVPSTALLSSAKKHHLREGSGLVGHHLYRGRSLYVQVPRCRTNLSTASRPVSFSTTTFNDKDSSRLTSSASCSSEDEHRLDWTSRSSFIEQPHYPNKSA